MECYEVQEHGLCIYLRRYVHISEYIHLITNLPDNLNQLQKLLPALI